MTSNGSAPSIKPWRRRQQGVTLLGMLLIGAVVAALAVVAAQVVPTVIEYQAVQKAVTRAARDASSVVDARLLFDRSSAVDGISSLTGKDLEISFQGERRLIRFAYQREIHLFGPAYLLLKYSGHSQ